MPEEIKSSGLAEMDVKELFFHCLSRWPIFIVVAVLCGVVCYCYGHFIIKETYSSSVQIYIQNAEIDENKTISAADITAATTLAKTYIVILNDPSSRQRVIDRLTEQGVTQRVMGGVPTIEQVGTTAVLKISAKSQDPIVAKAICNAYAAEAPEILTDVVQGGFAKPIGDDASEAKMVAPRVKRMMAYGFVIGFAVVLAAAVLQFMFDNTIKDGVDMKQRFEIPLLGEIPAFTAKPNKEAYYGKKVPS